MLYASADKHELASAFARTRPLPLLFGFLVVLFAVAAKAMRWRGLLASMGTSLSRVDSLFFYARGTFVGSVTPGRVGEIARMTPLLSRGTQPGVALAATLADRVFDAVVLIAAAAAALFVVRDPGSRVLVPVSLVCLAGGVVAYLGARRLAPSPRPPGLLLVPERWRPSFERAWRPFANGIAALGVREIAEGAAWSALSFALVVASNFLLAQSLGLPLSPLEVAGISALASLAALIPITLFGAGTRDAALIVLLAGLGIGRSDALAYSTLLLALVLWTALVSSWPMTAGAIRRSKEILE